VNAFSSLAGSLKNPTVVKTGGRSLEMHGAVKLRACAVQDLVTPLVVLPHGSDMRRKRAPIYEIATMAAARSENIRSALLKKSSTSHPTILAGATEKPSRREGEGNRRFRKIGRHRSPRPFVSMLFKVEA